jgi:hypothetical protein
LYVWSTVINVHEELIWCNAQQFIQEKNSLYVKSVAQNVHKILFGATLKNSYRKKTRLYVRSVVINVHKNLIWCNTRIHTGAKPFVCMECGYKCTGRIDLV